MKAIVIVNKDYKLSLEEEAILKVVNSNNFIIKKISKKKFLTTKKFRDMFESLVYNSEKNTLKYSVVFLLNIFHITIDIKYIHSFISRVNSLMHNDRTITFYIFKNLKYNICTELNLDTEPSFNNIFEVFTINELSQKSSNNINKYLKKTVQKIGRENSTKHLGRPVNTRKSSQYDRDKDLIRYKLDKKEMTPTEIHKELGYGSLTALRHFIKTRYRKKYL